MKDAVHMKVLQSTILPTMRAVFRGVLRWGLACTEPVRHRQSRTDVNVRTDSRCCLIGVKRARNSHDPF
jgi:hypothetical protein